MNNGLGLKVHKLAYKYGILLRPLIKFGIEQCGDFLKQCKKARGGPIVKLKSNLTL